MKVKLTESLTAKEIDAEISLIKSKELPLKKNGWKFNWRVLFKIEGAIVYKLATRKEPNKIEGLLMITIYNEEMVFMNNLEIAPHNYGSKGLYKDVAGCLIAYACLESFEKGIDPYNGFLSFDSKTELIELYQKKYGAKIANRHKMYFDPEVGKSLMKKYLKINYKPISDE